MESWLRTMPAGTLNRWIAFDSVEPVGEQWLQTASILQRISALFGLTAAVHGGGKFDPPEIEDLMPERYRKPKKPKEKVTLLSGDEHKGIFSSLLSRFKLKGKQDGNDSKCG